MTAPKHSFNLDLQHLQHQDFTLRNSYYYIPDNDEEEPVTNAINNIPAINTHPVTLQTENSSNSISPNTTTTHLATDMSFLPSGSAAPLPSPAAPSSSSGHRNSYFAPHAISQSSHQQQQQWSSQFQQQTQYPSQHSQQQQQQLGQRGAFGGYQGYPNRQDSTSSEASDMSCAGGGGFGDILAEAARRAQMHCVTRDLEDMGL